MNIDLDFILYISSIIVGIAGAYAIIHRAIKKTSHRAITSVTQKTIESVEERLVEKIVQVEKALREIIQDNQMRDEKTRRLTMKNTASRIFEAHNYYMRKGEISTFALANLEELYAMYELDSGNSHAKLCVEQLRKLPINDNRC